MTPARRRIVRPSDPKTHRWDPADLRVTAAGIRLSCFVLVLLVPLVAQGAFIRVTHFVDDFDDNNGTCTLREAIRSANSNLPNGVDACSRGLATQIDQVILPAGTHLVDLSAGPLEDFAVTGDLDIRDRVIVRGVDADFTFIDGAASGPIDRLFDVHDVADDVVIERVTLRGGDESLGGVVRVRAGVEVDLHQLELTGGVAAAGGGVFNAGTLNVTQSRIHGNQTRIDPDAGTNGGGLVNSGASASLTILDSVVENNSTDDHGGGLFDEGTSLTLHRTRFIDNVAARDGGGVFFEAANFDVDFVEFSGNQAERGGGAFMNEAGEIQRSALIGNGATAAGGGLYDAGAGFLRFSTVAMNLAPLGAGVYADSGQTLLDSNTIADNQGDGVYNQSGAFFENTLIAGHSAGNCTGTPPAFGALNLEDVDTCGFVSGPNGPNLPNTDPMLGPLADHGGPTPAYSLLPGSPAIDAVSSEIRLNCEKMLDQRGHVRGRPRILNGAGEADDVFLCDIGAFEVTTPFVVDTLVDGADADLLDDRCLTATGDCSLRAAIQQANATHGLFEVELGPGTHVLSIAGRFEDGAATGDLDIRPPLVLRGTAADLTSIDAEGIDRVLDIAPIAYMEPMDGLTKRTLIEDLTVERGDSLDSPGGGIRTDRPTRLERVGILMNFADNASGLYADLSRPRIELIDSTLAANFGNRAIFASEAHIERSTLANNFTPGANGGAGEFTRVRLVNSTVSGNFGSATGAFFASEAIIDGSAIYDNTSDAAPGGVFLLEQSVVRNSIIAFNRAAGIVDNCAYNPNAIDSHGANVTDTDASDCLLDAATDQALTDPLLDVLADNGGFTATHRPLAGSPVIDAGDDSTCLAVDQRGAARPSDGDQDGQAICDIGPYEVPEPAFAIGLMGGSCGLAHLARRRSTRRRGHARRSRAASDLPWAGAQWLTNLLDDGAPRTRGLGEEARSAGAGRPARAARADATDQRLLRPLERV